MAKSEQKLAWIEMDAGSLPPKLKALYDERRKAVAALKAIDEKFNPALIAELVKVEAVEKGANVKVSHNFGKLSFAIAPEGLAKPKGKALFKLG